MPGGPQWNALKHGLRGAAALLPGDDVGEFPPRQAEAEHGQFVQLAIRTHFGPGSRPVVPVWDGTVHPKPPVP